MRGRRLVRFGVLVLLTIAVSACGRPSSLPNRLDDREFWTLIESTSEPAGSFTLSDNLVSNEPRFGEAVKWLRPVGGAYVGVGPEQNFTYIARTQPGIAFVVDIRRENLLLHLLYKALFEIATDRADFVSRLFSRPRPAGLTSSAAVDDMFDRFDRVAPSAELSAQTLTLVRERLVAVRKLPVTEPDLATIELMFRVFYTAGPSIDYYGSRATTATRPTYRQLMTAKDFTGANQSYLSDEERFQFVKELQARNLIVPIVGDFGGPAAMRRVGEYVRAHGEAIRTVYASNVSVYLNKQQTLAFCANLASLPVAPGAWYIDSNRLRPLRARINDCGVATPAAQ